VINDLVLFSVTLLADSMPREKRYYVYILASKSRTLYIGVTGFLTARILQHKTGDTVSFTSRYNINRLVYYESFRYVNNAMSRETQLKSWSRKRKIVLIEAGNPLWDDLANDWGKFVDMKQQIPMHGLALAPPGSE
jgi:putative endonuclease